MNSVEIQDKMRANFEEVIKMRLEISELYLFSLLFIPKSQAFRIKLLSATRDFFLSKKNENEVLRFLDRAYISAEDALDIFFDIDTLSDQHYKLFDKLMLIFEESLRTGLYDRLPSKCSEDCLLDSDKKEIFIQRIIDLEKEKTIK